MKVIPGYIYKQIFRVSAFSYHKIVRSHSGFFFLNRRWWLDLEQAPIEIRSAVSHYAIDNERIYSTVVRRLRLREKLYLMSLMVTVEEASALTRIPVLNFEQAVSLCQVKTIKVGDKHFIPRVELERLLECLIDDEKIDRTCYLR
jgi:hypothetical protein